MPAKPGGSVLLKAGMNHIYARAIDTSGNVRTAVITVIAEQSQSLSPASLADPTFPALIGMSPVVALAAIHAFLWNRSRTPRKKAKQASGSRGSTRRPTKSSGPAAKGTLKR